jgi:hypothetical protein
LNKLGGKLRKTLLPALGVAALNEEVLAIGMAEFAKSLYECREKAWAAGWRARLNMPNFCVSRRPLRSCRQWPNGSRAAENCDELAPLHVPPENRFSAIPEHYHLAIS